MRVSMKNVVENNSLCIIIVFEEFEDSYYYILGLFYSPKNVDVSTFYFHSPLAGF